MTKQILTLYHGSNVAFEIFNRSGVRSTSALGLGHYLTPDISKAEQYGEKIMVFDVDISNCLDWNRLTIDQRSSIEQFLINHVPEGVVAKYGDTKYEVIPLTKIGLERLEELQRSTMHHESDAAKAKMVAYYDLPDHLKSIDRKTNGVVRWRDAGCFTQANTEQLLAVVQEYAPEVARHLGYSGAMFGNEVCIYDASLATKVDLISAKENFLSRVVDATNIGCDYSKKKTDFTNKVSSPSPRF